MTTGSRNRGVLSQVVMNKNKNIQASSFDRVYNVSMKIGVISDTHIEDLGFGVDFLNRMTSGPFAAVDLILHAGDIVHPDLLHCFDRKPIVAVKGNCDETAPELPIKRIFETDGFRIGLIHGWGGPSGIIANVLKEFSSESIDALVFGHSHYPLCRMHGDILLFNPGSALDRRDAPFHSAGILNLDEKISGRILNLEAELKSDPVISGAFA